MNDATAIALSLGQSTKRAVNVRTGVRRVSPNEVCISESQRKVHVTAEALAVFVVAPVTGYIAYKGEGLPDWARMFLGTVAVGTVIVDGGLLWSYHQKKKEG